MNETRYIEISDDEFMEIIGPLDVCLQIPENEYSYRTGITYFKLRWGNKTVGYTKGRNGYILPEYYKKGTAVTETLNGLEMGEGA